MRNQGSDFPAGTFFLVTGAAGFIGSNLVEALLSMGYKVRGLDNFAAGRKENIKAFLDNPLFEFFEGDIRSLDACKKACAGVDYVLHQAAFGSVLRSIEHPLLYEEVNIRGTLNMMQAALEAGVKRFVYASSSSAYGDSTELPKVEGREGKALSPYALTKAVNEEYGMLYYKLYRLKTVGLRYFNVFGRRQDPHSDYAAVIPAFIGKLLRNEPPTINGDGEQSRDFTYIENVLDANLKACLAPSNACGQSYNIGCGGSITINGLYNKLCEALGVYIKPAYGPERPGDIRHSEADIGKARRLLGYNPLWSAEDGIRETTEWYRAGL